MRFIANALALVGLVACLPSIAAECRSETKSKLAAISAEQSQKDELCKLLGSLSANRERLVSRESMSAVLMTQAKLRAAGYRESQSLVELATIETIRPPEDLSIVATLYEKTRGCLTPSAIYRDVTNALRANGRDAALMYKNWNRDGYVNYLVMISHAEGCKISG